MSSRGQIDDAMTAWDLEVLDTEFEEVCARIEPLFDLPASRAHARGYLLGLLALLEKTKKKNGWTIAEYLGAPEPKRLQRSMNLPPFDANRLRDVLVRYAMEHFADERAVLIANPTDLGTFLAYATPDGHRVLLDRELYLPEQSWAADPDQRREADVSDGVPSRTRQVRLMAERTIEAKVPFAWFLADEEFGQDHSLRGLLHSRSLAYVMAASKNTEVTDVRGRTARIKKLVTQLPEAAFTCRACGKGSKGFRTYDWALVDTPDRNHRFVVRRGLDRVELAYFDCFSPRRDPLSELVRAAGSRWPVEECFEAATEQAELDWSQVREHDAWYRHTTLTMLALCLLAVMGQRLQKH